METKERIEMWAIIELFGHQRIAGHVTEAEIGGCSFIRVDIPEVEGSKAITKFYGNGAIYSMTPVSEELVRTYVARYKPAPLNVYIPEIRQLGGRPEPDSPEEDLDEMRDKGF